MRITGFFFFLAGLHDGFYSEGRDIKSRRLRHLKKRPHQQQMLITDIWLSTAGAGIPYSCGVMRTPFFWVCLCSSNRQEASDSTTHLFTAPDSRSGWQPRHWLHLNDAGVHRDGWETPGQIQVVYQAPPNTPWLAEGSNVTLFKITLRFHISSDIPFVFFPTCIAAFLNRALSS